MSLELVAVLLSWVAIVLLGLALAGILRQLHELRAQLARPTPGVGPAPGQPLPGALADVTGLLLFASRTCGACTTVLPEAERIADERPGWHLEVLYQDHPAQRHAFEALDIPVTPFAVIADRGRVTAAAPTGSPAALRALISRTREIADAAAT